MRRLAALLTALLLLATLGACSPGDDDAGGGTGGDTAGGKAGACDDYEAGTDGVIRLFCDGSASATVTVKGTEHTVGGGSCEESGGYWTLNAGVVVGPDWTAGKPLPDYVGMNLPTDEGDFGGDNLVIQITVDGTSYGLTDVTGTRTGDSGSFTGTDRFNDGGEITGTFTCG